MEVRYLSPASEEFLDAVRYYESEAPGLGAEFVAALLEAEQLTADNPRIGSLYLGGTRRVLLKRFPFNFVYLEESDAIVVVALAHHRRRPGYWRDRLR